MCIRLMFLEARGRSQQVMECMLAVLETAILTRDSDLSVAVPRRPRNASFLIWGLVLVADQCVASTCLSPLGRWD